MSEPLCVCSKHIANPTDADKWKVDVHQSNAEVWHSHTPNGTPCDLPKSEYHRCPAPVEWVRIDARTEVVVHGHEGDDRIRKIIDHATGQNIGEIAFREHGYRVTSVGVERRKE